MLVSAFDFDLPEALIALRPQIPREAARLLVVGETLRDAHISDLAEMFHDGDVLIINDTRVMSVQLKGTRKRGDNTAPIEATLIKNMGVSNGKMVWQAFIKPGRKVKIDDELVFFSPQTPELNLKARTLSKDENGVYQLEFGHDLPDMLEHLEAIGAMPLPPYIRSKRREDAQDKTDYQTVFADKLGSVAAPTAGLHFTSDLIKTLNDKGVRIEHVTLHVGAGTFLPMKVENSDDHIMHAEYGIIDAATAMRLNEARANGGRLICVGTTSLRLLESACDDDGRIHEFAAETAIFITPGVKIKSCDMLLTNFHLPKSTLFMLTCAFAGTDVMKAAYHHAITTGYRFFSYGDACLLSLRS